MFCELFIFAFPQILLAIHERAGFDEIFKLVTAEVQKSELHAFLLRFVSSYLGGRTEMAKTKLRLCLSKIQHENSLFALHVEDIHTFLRKEGVFPQATPGKIFCRENGNFVQFESPLHSLQQSSFQASSPPTQPCAIQLPSEIQGVSPLSSSSSTSSLTPSSTPSSHRDSTPCETKKIKTRLMQIQELRNGKTPDPSSRIHLSSGPKKVSGEDGIVRGERALQVLRSLTKKRQEEKKQRKKERLDSKLSTLSKGIKEISLLASSGSGTDVSLATPSLPQSPAAKVEKVQISEATIKEPPLVKKLQAERLAQSGESEMIVLKREQKEEQKEEQKQRKEERLEKEVEEAEELYDGEEQSKDSSQEEKAAQNFEETQDDGFAEEEDFQVDETEEEEDKASDVEDEDPSVNVRYTNFLGSFGTPFQTSSKTEDKTKGSEIQEVKVKTKIKAGEALEEIRPLKTEAAQKPSAADVRPTLLALPDVPDEKEKEKKEYKPFVLPPQVSSAPQTLVTPQGKTARPPLPPLPPLPFPKSGTESGTQSQVKEVQAEQQQTQVEAPLVLHHPDVVQKTSPPMQSSGVPTVQKRISKSLLPFARIPKAVTPLLPHKHSSSTVSATLLSSQRISTQKDQTRPGQIADRDLGEAQRVVREGKESKPAAGQEKKFDQEDEEGEGEGEEEPHQQQGDGDGEGEGEGEGEWEEGQDGEEGEEGEEVEWGEEDEIQLQKLNKNGFYIEAKQEEQEEQEEQEQEDEISDGSDDEAEWNPARKTKKVPSTLSGSTSTSTTSTSSLSSTLTVPSSHGGLTPPLAAIIPPVSAPKTTTTATATTTTKPPTIFPKGFLQGRTLGPSSSSLTTFEKPVSQPSPSPGSRSQEGLGREAMKLGSQNRTTKTSFAPTTPPIHDETKRERERERERERKRESLRPRHSQPKAERKRHHGASRTKGPQQMTPEHYKSVVRQIASSTDFRALAPFCPGIHPQYGFSFDGLGER